jgi:hypothetical protein
MPRVAWHRGLAPVCFLLLKIMVARSSAVVGFPGYFAIAVRVAVARKVYPSGLHFAREAG